MSYKEVERRFKCPRFKINLNIIYYYEDERIADIFCPICRCIEPSPYGRQKCNGFYPNGEKCIIFLPYPHINTFQRR